MKTLWCNMSLLHAQHGMIAILDCAHKFCNMLQNTDENYYNDIVNRSKGLVVEQGSCQIS